MQQATRIQQLKLVQKEALDLFVLKNNDYGDAFATYGTIGILVRLGDKIHRLQSITSKGINLVEDEKLRDTLIDLHNYAAMGIMMLDFGETLSILPPPLSPLSPSSLLLSPPPPLLPSSISPPPPLLPSSLSPLLPPSLQTTFGNSEVEKINITGSTGSKYVLKRFKSSDGTFVLTCSCPSYQYCNDKCKTCKHIKQFLCSE